MKLHIKESYLVEAQLNYLTENLLAEILNDSDVIDELSNYIPNFDPTVNYTSYINNQVVQDIKTDVYNAIKELYEEILNIPKVRSVKIKKSPDMGLSNYVEVKFDKPVNAPLDWRRRYKNLYQINIKVSDHFTFVSPSVTHRLSILHQTLTDTKQSIMNIINNQLNLINVAEDELS